MNYRISDDQTTPWRVGDIVGVVDSLKTGTVIAIDSPAQMSEIGGTVIDGMVDQNLLDLMPVRCEYHDPPAGHLDAFGSADFNLMPAPMKNTRRLVPAIPNRLDA